MTKTKWKNLILRQMAALDVQKDSYDKTFTEFQESGGKSVIEYTNKGGSTNMTKNPLLILWDDLNKSALMYWRELGLTPSSYKKMTGDNPRKEKTGGLAEALRSIESG